MDEAKLKALGSMTDETDAANPDPEQQARAAEREQAATQSDIAAKQWGMLMFTVGGFAQMIAPELRPVYSEERCFAWGQQANAVAEKYGWNGPSAMPEIALIASTAGFAVPTYFLIRAKVQEARSRASANEGNALSVRLELQADCLAGVWAHHADNARQLLEKGDVEEAMNAAAKIGDDALQRSSGGTVVPESFTHGTSAQRQRWFNTGLQGGSVKGCDTFTARQL